MEKEITMVPTKTNKPQLPYPAEKLIPHRPPMLLIDQLVQRSDDRITATATTSFGGKLLFQVPKGQPSAELFIEIIAQTAAASKGFDDLTDDKQPKAGFLVGLDEFLIKDIPIPEAPLISEIKEVFKLGNITIFKGKLFCNEQLLASGKIQVWEES